MARPDLTIISFDQEAPLQRAWLEPFKQYASIPDDGRDALLEGLLRSALLQVQEYGDRALLRCRVRQTAHSDAKTGQIRLYLGGGVELSARTLDGEICPVCEQKAADIVVVSPRDADVVVEFDTVPLESWLVQAQPTVLRLATAMYDGASAEVRNSILNEVL
jgi:hypothetical protein